jgi:hypothetical protein
VEIVEVAELLEEVLEVAEKGLVEKVVVLESQTD